MRKKKIYLDTSVISYLRQEDAPTEMRDTLDFWEILKAGKYDVYISEVVIDELSSCAEPKRTELFALLEEIEYTNVKVKGNDAVAALEAKVNKLGVLPPKSESDRFHIAVAVHIECNIIVSWNFKHMVNVKTIDGVRMVCLENHITPVDIYTPTVLLEGRLSDG